METFPTKGFRSSSPSSFPLLRKKNIYWGPEEITGEEGTILCTKKLFRIPFVLLFVYDNELLEC